MNTNEEEIKSIIIQGKRNTDSLLPKKKRIRINAIDKITEFPYDKQIDILQSLYKQHLNIDIDIDNDVDIDVDVDNNNSSHIYKKILAEIQRKINGYKSQDIKRNIYQVDNFITFQEIIEKIYHSKLICYYCEKEMKIIYRLVRDQYQWTLDRIDNDIGHSDINTVVSCLKCNIQRKRMEQDKFNFTKKMTITKYE